MDERVRTIRERHETTLERIAAAAHRAGRAAESVRLVVVTKSQPLEVVRDVLAAGVTCLGENYPEEGEEKILALGEFSAVEWHMIGHVQSRKAGIVAQRFNFLHSLDGTRLAGRLNRHAAEAGRILPTLLEFNVGEEASKSGWPAWDEARWPEFVDEIAEIAAQPNLQIRGLMTMPPLGEDPQASRPFFQRLVRLRDFLAGHFPHQDWKQLSMGTSLDFEAAVEEGATLVRVGTAIVGPRRYRTEA